MSAEEQKAAMKKAEEDAAGQFDSLVRPFVTEHCIECHGFKKQKNGLNLESFETSASLIDDHERWAEVVKKLRGREMPPEEEPQPSEHTRQAVAGWLAKELDHIDRLTPPDPGRVTARRLNRTEYNNTIRDLLGVDAHPADDFPQDDAGYGFDNIADVLSLSPVLMEKYISSADRISRLALYGPPAMKPTLVIPRTMPQPSTENKFRPYGSIRAMNTPMIRLFKVLNSTSGTSPGTARIVRHAPRTST